VFFETAEEYFTEAMSVALGAGRSDLATAAQAGRAAARLWLEDYAGASQDASAVPVDFVFRARFENAGEPSNNNWIKYINSNNPYRELSVEKTFYETYYPETGDPRVAWTTDPKVPNAEFSYVKWLIPEKYPALDSPVRLSSGREMVLIQAETALRAGNWEDALMLLNSLRAELVSDVTGEPLDPWTATNATEAWSVLKRERGIELWLEGRRLGDLWRWVDQDTPGEMEDVTNLIRLCMPIAKSEMQTNPNIAIDHQSPTNPLFTGIRPDY
jgi:hypothetical protein